MKMKVGIIQQEPKRDDEKNKKVNWGKNHKCLEYGRSWQLHYTKLVILVAKLPMRSHILLLKLSSLKNGKMTKWLVKITMRAESSTLESPRLS